MDGRKHEFSANLEQDHFHELHEPSMSPNPDSAKQLPTLDSCNDCGVCCLHMGYPSYIEGENHWVAMPVDLRTELEATMADYQHPPEGQLDGPCCWYDFETRGCKHYEHRAQVCRDFEVGCSDCLGWRRELLLNP